MDVTVQHLKINIKGENTIVRNLNSFIKKNCFLLILKGMVKII